MKKLFLSIILIFLSIHLFSQNVGINSNGATPNAAAMLDIDVSALTTKTGLLIPRVTLVQKTAMNPLPAAAQGLVVYQTDGLEGFYYNTSTSTTPSWSYLSPATAGWSTTGNTGTTAGTNFIGTTDAVDFVAKTNNTERMRILSTGNVGIGTTAPDRPLTVKGTGVNNELISLKNSAGTTKYHWNLYSGGLNLAESGVADGRIYVKDATGNVGIGTTAPAQKLDVAGKIQMQTGAAVGYVPVSDANGTMTWTDPSTVVGGQVWKLTGNSSTSPGTNFIGTTDAQALMFKVNNQTAGYIDYATPFSTGFGYQTLNANTGINNAAFGYQALAANTTGTNNAAFGFSALRNNTTGHDNIAMGYQALNSSVSSVNNVAIGTGTLATLTTGHSNVAMGFWALLNTTGNQNTAVGVNALKGNTSGVSNVALGVDAGYDNSTAANSNTTGQGNTFIGAETGYINSTQRNFAAAIGYNAKVDASNAMVLGGTGAYAVNVGIGTTTPLDVLHVAGHIRMVDGSQGAGKMMVSDANGRGTWTSINSSAWTLSGNSGTTAGTNFIGTTDNQDLVFKVNNTEYFRFQAPGIIVPSNFNGNIGIGLGTMNSITTGTYNVSLGDWSMYSNTTGNDNLSFGTQSLGGNTTGSNNLALGTYALDISTTASNVTALGKNAGYQFTGGSYNTFTGSESGSFSSGTENTYVGFNSGSGSTGSSNLFLGTNAGQNVTASNKLYIDNTNTSTPLIYGDFGTNSVTVNDSLTSKYLKMTNGAANGYVLQSDANGNGKWVSPSSSVVAGTGLSYSGTTLNSVWTSSGTNIYNNNSGNVGIGTTVPATSLHIDNSTNSGPQITLSAPSGGTPGIVFRPFQTPAQWTNPAQALISATDNNYSADIHFWTKTPGAIANALTERVTILNNGNLGVGISAPTSTLHVNGAFATTVKTAQAAGTNNPDNTAAVWFYSSGTGTITLPTASTCSGRRYIIVNQTGAARTTSTFIDLTATSVTTLSNNTSIEIISDGTNWRQIK